MRDVHMCRLIEMMTDWASSYSADDDETGSQSAEKGMGCPPQNVYPGTDMSGGCFWGRWRQERASERFGGSADSFALVGALDLID